MYSKNPIHVARVLWFRSANVEQESLASDERVRQVGLMYGVYRFIIASFLMFANILLSQNLEQGGAIGFSIFNHKSFCAYLFFSLIAFFVYYVNQHSARKQLFVGFFVDVIFLTFFAISSKISDYQIMLLYMVVIAASFMLLRLSSAVILTLLTIVSVLYQQIVIIFLEPGDHTFWLNITNGLLISLSLVTVGFLSWSISQRLSNAELYLEEHAEEMEKLHTINQAVVQNMTNGVMVIDENRNIIVINQAAGRLLGLPAEKNRCDTPAQILELSRIVLKEHPKLIAWFRSVNQQESNQLIYQTPNQIITQQQKIDRLRITASPLSEHGQILILEDINQEEAMAQKMKLASLGQLSASIAHEIRNPLTAISQASELLLEDANEDDENYEFYNMIHQQTRRVNTIISDVLSLSRQEEPSQVAIEVGQWVRDFVALHFPQSFINITKENPLPMIIHFDPNHLEQILINLINNALRHTVSKAGMSDVEVRLSDGATGVFIDVLDNGDGVAEENLTDLFNPFFTTSQKGTGLGLYLSQSFSEANNAKIRYFRDQGRTCFRVIASKYSSNDKIKAL